MAGGGGARAALKRDSFPPSRRYCRPVIATAEKAEAPVNLIKHSFIRTRGGSRSNKKSSRSNGNDGGSRSSSPLPLPRTAGSGVSGEFLSQLSAELACPADASCSRSAAFALRCSSASLSRAAVSRGHVSREQTGEMFSFKGDPAPSPGSTPSAPPDAAPFTVRRLHVPASAEDLLAASRLFAHCPRENRGASDGLETRARSRN